MARAIRNRIPRLCYRCAPCYNDKLANGSFSARILRYSSFLVSTYPLPGPQKGWVLRIFAFGKSARSRFTFQYFIGQLVKNAGGSPNESGQYQKRPRSPPPDRHSSSPWPFRSLDSTSDQGRNRFARRILVRRTSSPIPTQRIAGAPYQRVPQIKPRPAAISRNFASVKEMILVILSTAKSEKHHAHQHKQQSDCWSTDLNQIRDPCWKGHPNSQSVAQGPRCPRQPDTRNNQHSRNSHLAPYSSPESS